MLRTPPALAPADTVGRPLARAAGHGPDGAGDGPPARRWAPGGTRRKVRLKFHPAVADYFKERIQRLQSAAGGKLEIHSSSDINWEDYHIIVE